MTMALARLLLYDLQDRLNDMKVRISIVHGAPLLNKKELQVGTSAVLRPRLDSSTRE